MVLPVLAVSSETVILQDYSVSIQKMLRYPRQFRTILSRPCRSTERLGCRS